MSWRTEFIPHGSQDRLPQWGKGRHAPIPVQAGITYDCNYKNRWTQPKNNHEQYAKDPSRFWAPPSLTPLDTMVKRGEPVFRVVNQLHRGPTLAPFNTGKQELASKMNGIPTGADLQFCGIARNDAHTSGDPGKGTVMAFGTDSTFNTGVTNFAPGQTVLMKWKPEFLPNSTEPKWRYLQAEQNAVNFVGEPESSHLPSMEVYHDIHEYCECMKMDKRAQDNVAQYGRDFAIADMTDAGWIRYAKDILELGDENKPSYQYFKLAVALAYLEYCVDNVDNGVSSSELIEALNNCKKAVQDSHMNAVDHATGDFQVLYINPGDAFENSHPSYSARDLPLSENANTFAFTKAFKDVLKWTREQTLYLMERMIADNYKRLLGVALNASAPGGQLDVMLKLRGG